VTLAEAERQARAQKRKGWVAAWPAVQLVVATVFLALPAIYNGFPLLYPDSMTYLDDGRIVARALFLHHFSDYYGVRSFFYSLVILPFHCNRTAWPIVALQCFLLAFVLRLVCRSIVPRMVPACYLALVLFLSLFTSAGWFSSLILPDVLGSILYLSIFLLAFAGETLSRVERLALSGIAFWGVASHASHLLLAAALCLPIATMLAVQCQPVRRILRIIGEIAAIVAIAAASQLALHAYLYGHPSLNGERPPFLMARVVSDGPGRWYLEKHCASLQWTICRHLQNLSDDPDIFLWSPDGLWQTASEEEQQRLRREEMPLVFAVLRAYPIEQLRYSASNFWLQLRFFGIYDLDPSSWVQNQFDTVMPAAHAGYLRSMQARNALPLELLTTLQFWVVIGSLLLIAIFSPLLGSARPARLASLTALVAFVVVVNAAITGVLSMPEDRFQSRVIWMVPLVAQLYVLAWFRKSHFGGSR